MSVVVDRTITIQEEASKGLTLTKGANAINKLKKYTYFTLKRTFDIMCSIIGITLTIPIALFVKIAYVFNGDFDSIFFVQNRIGKNGKEFKFYKFRSMKVNADEELKNLLENNPEIAKEYKKNKKLRNDPRITKVGNFLRKTSLDEMPQFINVLKGDMAVVGNRPYLPREKEDMGEYFDTIESTKCGIISLWAINGRSDVSFDERMEFEQFYSEHQSLKLDLKIFFGVFKIVLLRKGAK